ncbi:uncharacterized protein BDW43DRAFT_230374 [Aspergillus alliaceus]|uniref:uncharacterized protein n=1 Tax=Petromyces alliaceus TaxID=209559 RepID=UPI0012A459FE|nr:uncharacterized protein BDW43DRAFT_230374 [Aspergillus alliaceus]KAB8237072.1 hypothetical protein BDW43DRAFT_230374 [Aspergillus alliaceus]
MDRISYTQCIETTCMLESLPTQHVVSRPNYSDAPVHDKHCISATGAITQCDPLSTWKIRVQAQKRVLMMRGGGWWGNAKENAKEYPCTARRERLRRIFWKPFMQLTMETQRSVNRPFGPSGSSRTLKCDWLRVMLEWHAIYPTAITHNGLSTCITNRYMSLINFGKPARVYLT